MLRQVWSLVASGGQLELIFAVAPDSLPNSGGVVPSSDDADLTFFGVEPEVRDPTRHCVMPLVGEHERGRAAGS